ARLRQFLEFQFGGLGELFLDDLVAEVDALVADVHAGSGDQLLDLLLRLPAERALQQVGVTEFRHAPLLPRLQPRPGSDAGTPSKSTMPARSPPQVPDGL